MVANCSITLTFSRIIYNSESKEVFYSLKNNNNSPYLLQSWIHGLGGSKAPFITTPPLFKIDEGAVSNIRIVYTGKGDLPKDKESLFYLNILSIPAKEKTEDNKITLNTKAIIKIIYRPERLKASDAKDAYRKLSFKKDNNGFIISNPTPYYVNLEKIFVNNKELSPEVVSGISALAPFSINHIRHKSKVNTIKFTALSDRGAPMESEDIHI